MSQITRTYNFTDGTTAYGSQVETEVQNIVTTWNNHDSAVSAWTALSVTNNVTIGGTLAVTGALAFSSNLSVGGTLGVTGATTLSSTLGVTGATTLSSTLGVTGATTLSSTLAVTGDTTMTGHLGIGVAPFASTFFHVRVAANENLEVRDNSGLAISALNNSRAAFVAMNLEASSVTLKNGATILSLVGTTTNDDASAGNVGEYPTIGQVTTPANMAASNTFANITSISLTAGDWDIVGSGIFLINGATLTSGFALAISTNTGNTTTDHVDGDNVMYASVSTLDKVSILVHYRLKLSAPASVFLKSAVSYSGGGPPKAAGTIKARRER